MSENTFPLVDGDGYSPHAPELATGNPHDDDARIIDEDFLEVDMPPEKIPSESVIAITDRPKKTNRTLTGTLQIPVGGFTTPQQILPLDANRSNLRVQMRSTTAVATDFVRVADDGNKCESIMGSYLLFHASSNYDPTDCTSPVFVHGKDLTSPAYVSWWSVTE